MIEINYFKMYHIDYPEFIRENSQMFQSSLWVPILIVMLVSLQNNTRRNESSTLA